MRSNPSKTKESLLAERYPCPVTSAGMGSYRLFPKPNSCRMGWIEPGRLEQPEQLGLLFFGRCLGRIAQL
jgi:hypothetical protein